MVLVTLKWDISIWVLINGIFQSIDFLPFKMIALLNKSTERNCNLLTYYRTRRILLISRKLLLNPILCYHKLKLSYFLYKVHIFWEGHKNFAKSSPYFWLAFHTKVRWRFRKIRHPSQNIWTLISKVKSAPLMNELEASNYVQENRQTC